MCSKILATFNEVCDAVAQLHAQNPPILHRDLKVLFYYFSATIAAAAAAAAVTQCDNAGGKCPLQS
jgi:serine/threonine protein kinase